MCYLFAALPLLKMTIFKQVSTNTPPTSPCMVRQRDSHTPISHHWLSCCQADAEQCFDSNTEPDTNSITLLEGSNLQMAY